jgi:hypothetical protein
MCGEVWLGHSSPDTDVHGALTDVGEATAIGVRGYPRHMVRGNRVRPASVQSRLKLVVDASGNVSHGVRLVESRERRGPAGKALRSRCVSPLLARSTRDGRPVRTCRAATLAPAHAGRSRKAVSSTSPEYPSRMRTHSSVRYSTTSPKTSTVYADHSNGNGKTVSRPRRICVSHSAVTAHSSTDCSPSSRCREGGGPAAVQLPEALNCPLASRLALSP